MEKYNLLSAVPFECAPHTAGANRFWQPLTFLANWNKWHKTGRGSVESQRRDSKVPSWKHGSLIVSILMYSFCLIERGRDGDLRAHSKECSEYLKPASLFLPWPIHSQLVGHARLWLVSPLAKFLKLRSMSKWKNQLPVSLIFLSQRGHFQKMLDQWSAHVVYYKYTIFWCRCHKDDACRFHSWRRLRGCRSNMLWTSDK